MTNVVRFVDGTEFDVDGPLRVEQRKNVLYVVGEGALMPVASMKEAEELMAQLRRFRARTT
jgi:hypothetical protein